MGTPSTRHAEFLRTEGVALLAFSVLFYALHRAGACFHLGGARSQTVDRGAPSRKLTGSRALEPCVYVHCAPGIRCIGWAFSPRIFWPDLDCIHRLRSNDG